LFLALGHFRHGILLAPATAHYLAEVVGGADEPEALRPFAWEGRTRAAAPRRAEGG
jgi:glycine/D-amino acid oxidase-like deaminating enzyme